MLLISANNVFSPSKRDLCDGVRFRELLEVLSGKPVAIPHAQADTRLKQVSNVTALLNFLQDDEKLRLLSIGNDTRQNTHTLYLEKRTLCMLSSVYTVLYEYSIRFRVCVCVCVCVLCVCVVRVCV